MLLTVGVVGEGVLTPIEKEVVLYVTALPPPTLGTGQAVPLYHTLLSSYNTDTGGYG